MKNAQIALISMCAMVCVIWWHCWSGSSAEGWFIPAFCTWSVPWFFVVSGIFFRRTMEKKSNLEILQEKSMSLLLPYVLWCVIGLAIYPCVLENGWDVFAVALQDSHPLSNRALWYVRTLMILMVLGTISFRLCGILFRRGLGSLLGQIIFLAVYVFLVKVFERLGLALGPGSSFAYFVVGILLSPALLGGRCVVRHNMFAGFACLVVVVLLRSLWFTFDAQSAMRNIVGNGCTIFTIASAWLLIGEFADRIYKCNWLCSCCSLTAFVYFCHYPCNDLIRSLLNSFNHEVVFFLMVLLCPALYLSAAWTVKTIVPRVYGILSGGR